LNKVDVLCYDADPPMTEAESGSFGTFAAGDRQGGQLLRAIFVGRWRELWVVGVALENCRSP
jgi:hypothetical protein